jgi:hypothetical protein
MHYLECIESTLVKKEIGLESVLSDDWGVENVFKRKEIGFENALERKDIWPKNTLSEWWVFHSILFIGTDHG